MKKNIYLLPILLVIVLFTGGSCKKKDITRPPELAKFLNTGTQSYPVKDDASSVFKIAVGLTQPAPVDRTFTFTVTSPTGAVEGTQYTIPSKTVTIPAGQTIDSIAVKGIFNGYAGGRKDTLVFTLTSGNAPFFTGGTVSKVVLQQFCPLDMNIFSGDFEVLVDEWEDYTPGDIITLTKLDATSFTFNHAKVLNPLPIKILVNATTNAATIAKQTIGTKWTWGAYNDPTMSATGSVVTCEQTLRLTATYGFSTSTFTGTYALVLKKK